MLLSLSSAGPLGSYDLGLLTDPEIRFIQETKNSLLKRCRAHSCFEFRKMVGVSSGAAAVLRDKVGKPYFAGLNYNISISHKDENCWLGVAEKPGILGVDIEKKISSESTELMFRHIANEVEREQYQSLSQIYSLESYLTILWSLKESLYKCENGRHEDIIFLIQPEKQSATLKFNPGCYLENLWETREIQIKYSLQEDYVCSSIHIF